MSSVPSTNFLVLLIATVALTIGAGGAAYATAGGTDLVSTPAVQDGEDSPEADWEIAANSSMSADVQANGDARWTLSTHFDLSSANETAAYRELEESFLDDSSSAGVGNSDASQLGFDGFERAVESVDQHTDREMELVDVERASATNEQVESGTGELVIEFTWTNFARTEDSQLIIDDVFQTESGELWLPRLYDDQRLTITAPSDFGVFDSGDDVSPDEGKLQWEGPMEFTDESLRATFIGTNDGGPTPSGLNTWVVVLVVSLATMAVLLAVLVTRGDRRGITLPTPFKTSEADAAESPTDSVDTASTADQTDGEPSPPAGTTDSGESGDTNPSTSDDEPDEIDVELLSDEERVERLLSQNGGRMKQANIVKETDWSNAKVSQLLSSMEEEGRIDKLRIGRENLISFPDEDITEN